MGYTAGQKNVLSESAAYLKRSFALCFWRGTYGLSVENDIPVDIVILILILLEVNFYSCPRRRWSKKSAELNFTRKTDLIRISY